MSENCQFEIRAETFVTFDVFRRFFYSVQKRRGVSRILIEFSPHIFLTGLFFCLLNMMLYKDDALNGVYLAAVLLLGCVLLLLYIVPPRIVYNAMKQGFVLPYKYLFTESGFFVEHGDFDSEKIIRYSDLDVMIETKTSFYFSYRRKVCIIEKSGFVGGKADFMSEFLKSKNPEKYIELKS